MKIVCNLRLDAELAETLRQAVSPCEILETPSDASAPDIEIAFGQPEVSLIEKLDGLRWIHVTSAGYTRYDTPPFRAMAARRKLILTNSSAVYAGPCAEHLLAFMLAQSRRLPEALRTRTATGTPEYIRLRELSRSLVGEKVLLLGMGAIAVRLIELLAPLRMEIAGFRRKAKGNEPVPVVTPGQLPAALATADHVINILPDNADSRNFVDAKFLTSMKRGAIFYNIGRGTTVAQEALADALRSGHLEAAWLDVTDPEPLPAGHPLLSIPNCFITPHTGGGHRNENESLVRHFMDNFGRYRAGEPLLDRVI